MPGVRMNFGLYLGAFGIRSPDPRPRLALTRKARVDPAVGSGSAPCRPLHAKRHETQTGPGRLRQTKISANTLCVRHVLASSVGADADLSEPCAGFAVSRVDRAEVQA